MSNVFAPSEASCRECKKRWELGVAEDAAKAAKAASKAASRPPSKPPTKGNALAGCAVLLALLVVAGGIITGIVLAVGKADRDSGRPRAKAMLTRIPGCSGTSSSGALSIGDLGSNEASEARHARLPDDAIVTLAQPGAM